MPLQKSALNKKACIMQATSRDSNSHPIRIVNSLAICSFSSPDQTEEKGCNNDDGDYDEDDPLPTDRAGLLFRDRFLLFLLLGHDFYSGGMIPRRGEGVKYRRKAER